VTWLQRRTEEKKNSVGFHFKFSWEDSRSLSGFSCGIDIEFTMTAQKACLRLLFEIFHIDLKVSAELDQSEAINPKTENYRKSVFC